MCHNHSDLFTVLHKKTWHSNWSPFAVPTLVTETTVQWSLQKCAALRTTLRMPVFSSWMDERKQNVHYNSIQLCRIKMNWLSSRQTFKQGFVQSTLNGLNKYKNVAYPILIGIQHTEPCIVKNEIALTMRRRKKWNKNDMAYWNKTIISGIYLFEQCELKLNNTFTLIILRI